MSQNTKEQPKKIKNFQRKGEILCLMIGNNNTRRVPPQPIASTLDASRKSASEQASSTFVPWRCTRSRPFCQKLARLVDKQRHYLRPKSVHSAPTCARYHIFFFSRGCCAYEVSFHPVLALALITLACAIPSALLLWRYGECRTILQTTENLVTCRHESRGNSFWFKFSHETESARIPRNTYPQKRVNPSQKKTKKRKTEKCLYSQTLLS